ncbi:MAG TPA: DUF2203 domain-containing protein [Gemmatimonadaceae bacterium]|jgi:hypothetical protein|nr:DUF2203 domain-containing protein [Gemmatimonadaceae bacterium]
MQLFTVEQANATLPLVRRIVEDIVQAHRAWRDKILELDLAASGTSAPGAAEHAAQLEREVQAMAHEISGFQRELDALGIELKDPRLGLVDFPSEMNGRRVLLCWRLGEPEIQYWHELDTGFAGRQPLSPSLVG